MADRLTKLTRVLAAALAAPALLSSGIAFGQTKVVETGPYHPQDASHRRGHVWREGYCGERSSVKAPDIMTFDRKTGSEVMVGHGPGATDQVTGINRTTGSAYSVSGDLAGPGVEDFCTVNGETGSAYSIEGRGGAEVVKGLDGGTGHRFEVSQGPDGKGPDYKGFDPATGRIVEVVTLPDGRIEVRDPFACTRARLGLGIDLSAHAHVNDVRVGGTVGGDAAVTLGAC